MNMRNSILSFLFIGGIIAATSLTGFGEGEPKVSPRAFIDGTGEGWKSLGPADFINVNGA